MCIRDSAYGTKNATAEQVAVKAHARKRHSGNVLDIVPEGTPTEVVEHRLCEEIEPGIKPFLP